jgi:hypothetical protein
VVNRGQIGSVAAIGLAALAFYVPAASAGGFQRSDVLTSKAGGASVAGAAQSRTLSTNDLLNRIADDVTGATDMTVGVEDDPTEWASFFPPGVTAPDVLGFVYLDYAPLYHDILLSPDVYPAFAAWLTSGTPAGNEYNFAVAAMTLVHEAFHWRLNSGDESTVNACALEYLPYYLSSVNDFNVPETIEQTTTEEVPVVTTTTIPVKHVKVTKRRVKVHKKWVIRTRRKTTITYKTVTKTTYVSEPSTSEVSNPLFETIVADAADFYAHQPPPYNAGTCTV